MTVPRIIDHLKMVAAKEGISYEEEALNVIAEKADGDLRQGHQLLIAHRRRRGLQRV